MMGKTETNVHGGASEIRLRDEIKTRDVHGLYAMHLFVQLLIALSAYLYPRVGTPGFLSILLSLPYLFFLGLWAKNIRRRVHIKSMMKDSGRPFVRLIHALVFLYCLWDAQYLFYSLCAVIKETMPGESVAGFSLMIAVFLAVDLRLQKSYALLRMFSAFKWVIAFLMILCAIGAYSHGKAAHFFPLLGHGVPSILRGSLWCWSAVSGISLSVFAESSREQRSKPHFSLYIIALASAFILSLISVYLMPISAMELPRTLGWRLMALTNMTPSIPAWSMQVIALLMLFLLALHHRMDSAARMLKGFAGLKNAGFVFYLLLSLTLCPIVLFGDEKAADALFRLFPFRALLSPLLLFFISFGGKKYAICPMKEAAS